MTPPRGPVNATQDFDTPRNRSKSESTLNHGTRLRSAWTRYSCTRNPCAKNLGPYQYLRCPYHPLAQWFCHCCRDTSADSQKQVQKTEGNYLSCSSCVGIAAPKPCRAAPLAMSNCLKHFILLVFIMRAFLIQIGKGPKRVFSCKCRIQCLDVKLQLLEAKVDSAHRTPTANELNDKEEGKPLGCNHGWGQQVRSSTWQIKLACLCSLYHS